MQNTYTFEEISTLEGMTFRLKVTGGMHLAVPSDGSIAGAFELKKTHNYSGENSDPDEAGNPYEMYEVIVGDVGIEEGASGVATYAILSYYFDNSSTLNGQSGHIELTEVEFHDAIVPGDIAANGNTFSATVTAKTTNSWKITNSLLNEGVKNYIPRETAMESGKEITIPSQTYKKSYQIIMQPIYENNSDTSYAYENTSELFYEFTLDYSTSANGLDEGNILPHGLQDALGTDYSLNEAHSP